jgi:hypothetical protein
MPSDTLAAPIRTALRGNLLRNKTGGDRDEGLRGNRMRVTAAAPKIIACSGAAAIGFPKPYTRSIMIISENKP